MFKFQHAYSTLDPSSGLSFLFLSICANLNIYLRCIVDVFNPYPFVELTP